jgi:hypothetical protein
MPDLFEREPLPVALLRAPAALAVGAFVVGIATGAVVGPFVAANPAIGVFERSAAVGTFAGPGLSGASIAAIEGTPLIYLLVVAICAPFLLPTAWYRRHPALWYWMTAAATVATIRAVFMAGFLLPYQSPGPWLLKTSMDLLAAGVLWLAAIAVRRTPFP